MQHCCGHRRELPRSPRPQPLPPSGKDLGPSCGECDLCRQPPPPKSQPCGAGRPAVPERGGVMKAPAQPGANSSDRQLGQTELDCPERLDFVFFQFWSLLHKEPPNRSLRTFCSSDGPSLGPSMSMQYEKFQHLESEKQSQRSRNGVSGRVTEDLCWSRRGQRPGRPLPPSVLGQPPTSITCASPPPGQVPGALLPQSPALTPSSLTGLPPPLSFLHQLCSGPRPLLFSLGLSLLLLVGICVIGSQNSKFRRDLATLRATFSNFTANTVAEVQALKSQGGHLQEVITSLKAEVENHKQGLQAARSLNDKVFSLESKLEQEQKELKAGSQNTCCPPNWLEYGGSCYWFSGSGKTWEDADRYCQLESAHLVVINSREEQTFVQGHIGSYTWMGLSDPEGVWKWVDGTDYETNFKNWKPGQPDDWHGHGLGGGEDCAHFHPDGKWNDDACQRAYRWVCEAGLGTAS
uniref:C-type lectin domain family 10 member A-like isoform X9 n=1 Tax=Halichoerus grypus TaxID=9711 RepID=UPI0016592C22|nr:C-type lectin domain family 10 member A-like isoform X9 [Halichoerus grypus]